MNPIMKLLNLKRQKTYNANPSNSSSSQGLNNVLSEIKSGKINPRQRAIKILEQMSPQQKTALKQLLPQLSQFGKIMGVSEKNLGLFTTEINKYL